VAELGIRAETVADLRFCADGGQIGTARPEKAKPEAWKVESKGRIWGDSEPLLYQIGDQVCGPLSVPPVRSGRNPSRLKFLLHSNYST